MFILVPEKEESSWS